MREEPDSGESLRELRWKKAMTYAILVAWASIAGALLGYHLKSKSDPCWQAIEEYQSLLQSTGPDDEAWTEVELICEDGM